MSWRESDQAMQRRFIGALQVWLKGDQAAIRFAIDVVYVAHLWDDLIDRDRERTNEEISAAFKVCLFDLLANPFYARNIGPACAASLVWSKATGALREVFASTTLEELAGAQQRLDTAPERAVR